MREYTWKVSSRTIDNGGHTVASFNDIRVNCSSSPLWTKLTNISQTSFYKLSQRQFYKYQSKNTILFKRSLQALNSPYQSWDI